MPRNNLLHHSLTFPQVWHVLKDRVPILYKLLLADVLAPILVNFRKERLNPRIGNIDVEWKMMIEDVNEFELSLRHMTVSADIELVEDSFWVRHGLYKKYSIQSMRWPIFMRSYGIS